MRRMFGWGDMINTDLNIEQMELLFGWIKSSYFLSDKTVLG